MLPSASPVPFTGSDLHGLTLGNAFRKVVIGDPIVQAYSSILIAQDEKWLDVFETGRFPYWLPGHRWPIVTTAEWLVQESLRLSYFEDLAAINQGLPRPKPKPSDDLSQACRAIADRLTAFFEYLASGEVDVVDIYGLKPGPAAWSRPGAMIDVQTSDYYLDYKQVSFRGLRLQATKESAAAPRPLSTPNSPLRAEAGREPSYNYERLKEDLRKHCATHGLFTEEREFVTWCVKNAELLPGCAPPKGAGKYADRRTIKAAIKRHGLERIGLADSNDLEKGKSIPPG
jgi:hypothetical protein